MFRSGNWQQAKTTDPAAIALFSRHYSSDERKAGKWKRYGFAGTGETLALMTPEQDALFVWRREKYRSDGQGGVECSVFRNESLHRSSDLIIEAMTIAQQRWPGQRLFTFVDASKVASRNPGYCFKCAGWQRAGVSGKGLVILEIEAQQESKEAA